MVLNKFCVNVALEAVCHSYARVTELILVVASDSLISVFGVWLEHFELSPAILPGVKSKMVKGIVVSFTQIPAPELAVTFKTP